MNLQKILRLLVASALAGLPLSSQATVFFSDTFTNGSTVVSTSPAAPTATNAAYQEISAKSWSPNPPTIANGFLRFGMVGSSSGAFEIQSLFATNAIALTQPNDYIQLAVVFTNRGGVFTASGQLGIGLYNSGQVQPLPGGTNNATTSTTISGGAQNWLGYMAILGTTSSDASRVFTRPAQSAVSTGNNQDLVVNGSSSQAYTGSTTLSGSYGFVSLAAGSTVTEVLTINLIDANTLGITNTLYSGAGTGGTILTNYGGSATGANLLTSGFDALGLGYRSRSGTATSNVIDVASIQVSGSVTVISGPPLITAEPVPVSVATNGSCFFAVSATGFNMVYQWYHNGAALSNGGDYSGATSSTLVITNASTSDLGDYYCKITGAGNYSTNSTTNALTLVAAKNLVWNGAGATWDFANLYWNDTGNGNNPTNFNYGDSVTFDDTGAGNIFVNLSDSFLGASKWLVTGSQNYQFSGSGHFAGSGTLVLNSSAGLLLLSTTNINTGGTIVSNSTPSTLVYCSQYGALGNGPLTLATPGSLEMVPAGGPSTGFAGDVSANDDFTLQLDGTGSYAGVFLGNIAGASGKTLSLVPGPSSISLVNRYRIYGNNTVCDANIAINPTGATTSQAQYDGTVLAPYGSGTQVYNGVISGNGGIVQRGGTTILNGANTYSGGTTPTTATIGLGNDAALGTGPLVIAPEVPGTTGSGTIYASGGARTIANAVVYPSGTNNLTLIIGGTNNITFTSGINLAGADGNGNPGGRTLQINNTAATTLSSAISDTSGNNLGLNKTGSGTLYLNGANTFAGVTTNSAGTLAGSGSLTGSVVVKSGASISGGSSANIGTLSVGGNLTIESGGGGYFRVNRSGSQSDKVSVTGSRTSSGTGTITVTNIGAALQEGDSFTLFNGAVTGADTLVVSGGVGSGLTWTNKLAQNGTIQVIQSIASYSTNITAKVNGNNLEITWPATHLGWMVQAQTNALNVGLSNNWVTISNTATVTGYTNTIDRSQGGVYYRLRHP